MKEDKQKKRESVIKHLNGDEVQFLNDIKKVLMTYFDKDIHRHWIDDFVFSCRNKVAYFLFTEQKYIDIVQQRYDKFESVIMRELKNTELMREGEALKIELKLID